MDDTRAYLTQSELILNWLLTGKTLTPMEALREFGCFRLAARIGELRECTEIHSRIESKRGRRYAVYWI